MSGGPSGLVYKYKFLDSIKLGKLIRFYKNGF